MKKNKIRLAMMAVFVMFLFATMTFAATDNILSQNIKEADGTSGQNTNSGSGVKTDHIQDGAVTTNKIANGAITDAKITGLISASKIQKSSKVAIVAQSGGDYMDPVDAMNNLPAWCGTPSTTNPCLLKIMPGVYDIGAINLQMVRYVDIEGSGQYVTKITGSTDSGCPQCWDNGVVIGVSDSELRSITVENRGGTGIANSVAISIFEAAAAKITDVTVIASGGSYQDVGVSNRGVSDSVITNLTAYVTGGTNGTAGIANIGSSPRIINARIDVPSGTAIWNYCSEMLATNLVAINPTQAFGVWSYCLGTDTTVRIFNSVIGGTVNSAYQINSGATYVANSHIASGSAFGNVVCAGVTDGSLAFYTNTCP